MKLPRLISRSSPLFPCAVVALVLLSACLARAGDLRRGRMPINPAYLRWAEAQASRTSPGESARTAGATRRGGRIPSPIDYSFLKGAARQSSARNAGVARRGNAALPSSWDSRARGWTTPVRDQGDWGTCWAHSAMACLETVLKKETGRSVDLSEKNLVNLSGFWYEPYSGKFDSGGLGEWAVATLVRWCGPVLESQDPYPAPRRPPDDSRAIPPAYHVQDVRFVAARADAADNDALKRAIMAYGAVDVCYCDWHDSPTYYNAEQAAQYYDGTWDCSHEVVAVGWDDDYPLENFGARKPAGNGAFLVKNSWGEGFGRGGYMWISYHDTRFASDLSFAYPCPEPADNYLDVAQYDPYGCTDLLYPADVDEGAGEATEIYGANVFRAARDSCVAAVGFYCTGALGVDYEISVYADCEEGPTSGTLRSRQEGRTPEDCAGYFTVPLATKVNLRAGDRYAVTIRFSNFRAGETAYSYESWWEYSSCNADAGRGESFYSLDGLAWTDLTDYDETANFCCKAYLANREGGVVRPVTAPVLSPGTRTFSGTLAVTCSCADGEAVVRYAESAGQTPDESSPIWPNGETREISETTTICARSFRRGYEPSPVVTATYTKAEEEPPADEPAEPEPPGDDPADVAFPAADDALSPTESEPLDAAGVAVAYDGYLFATNAGGAVVGVVTVKIDRKGRATATVTRMGARKRSYKGVASTGEVTLVCSKEPDMPMTLSVFAGGFEGGCGPYRVRGRRNVAAENPPAYAGLVGRSWTAALRTKDDAPETMRGYGTLTIAAAKKGKVKVTGALPDGTRVSASAQTEALAQGGFMIPLVLQTYAGKAGGLSLVLRIDAAGETAELRGVGPWVAPSCVVTWDSARSRVAPFVAGIARSTDVFALEEIPDAIDEMNVATQFLGAVSGLTFTGRKWEIAKPVGKIRLIEGAFVDLADSRNPAGLKLTFAPKTGAFKGGLSVYADKAGRVKKFSAAVNGALVGAEGYGTAVIRRRCSLSVAIRPQDE